MSDRRILFVVEGERADPRFLKKMHQIYFHTHPKNVFSYNTCIHHLLKSMQYHGKFDENLDIIAVLRESANNQECKMLDSYFSQVYLIFDMDPHDPQYDSELMLSAMDYFSDPTDHGKLYLNYPMLESYKHMRFLGDDRFYQSSVSLCDVPKYKKIVEAESCKELKCLTKYDEHIFNCLIKMNIQKFSLIVDKPFSTLSIAFYESLCLKDLLKKQESFIDSEKSIYIINTSLFMPVDLNPSLVPIWDA